MPALETGQQHRQFLTDLYNKFTGMFPQQSTLDRLGVLSTLVSQPNLMGVAQAGAHALTTPVRGDMQNTLSDYLAGLVGLERRSKSTEPEISLTYQPQDTTKAGGKNTPRTYTPEQHLQAMMRAGAFVDNKPLVPSEKQTLRSRMAAGFLKQGAPADDVALWVQYGNTFPVAKMELMLKGARTHDPRAEQLAMLQRAAAMEILKGKVTPQMALSLGGPTAVERNWLGIRNQVNPEGALTGLSQMMRQLMLGGSGGPIIEDDVANRVAGNLGVE